MIEIEGSAATARVYASAIGAAESGQLAAICSQPFAEGARIRVMPDCHPGKGCVVGFTMSMEGGMLAPHLVGADLGCGMLAVRFLPRKGGVPDFARLDAAILESGIASAASGNEDALAVPLDELTCAKQANLPRARASLGTLGYGNHFCEIDRDSAGGLWFIVHTGSRSLGAEVSAYWCKMAHKACPESAYELSYLTGQAAQACLQDMALVQAYASANRRCIWEILSRRMKWQEEERFETVHNYVDTEDGILRKGAIAAPKGRRVLVPLNMRDGALICEGLGNADYNFSAPHGAGRRYARSEVKNRYTVNQFKKDMAGIHACVGKGTLDESPFAYKDPCEVEPFLAATVTITERLRPIYNFKNGSQE